MRHVVGIFALTKSPFGKNRSYEVSTLEQRYDVLGQVWYLIVSIPDLCLLLYSNFLSLFIVFTTSKPPFAESSGFHKASYYS